MGGTEEKREEIWREKQKIRQRYKGIGPEKLEVIPVTVSQPDFFDDSEPKRVAVYARVSTGDPRQTSSYELQKNYYEGQVKKHPNWTLVEIYADEGLSGTSTKKRKEFNRMLEDCRAGKIDLILTKSISRFARNYVDCGHVVRELLALNPPVGVRFESENIFTPKMDGEMQLMIFAGMAQEESRIKSNAMNTSIEMRFSNGIFLTPPLLGYDRDEDGNLVVNEEEAKIVRLIFFLYLYGYTSRQIADTLTQLGCRTKKGNVVWSDSSVLQILQNERHCGAVKARKTYTPDYLDHKSRKNRGYRRQYIQKEHHEPIILPEDYLAVQKLIHNAKYGGRGILPVLHAVQDGALRGFVSINPRWAGFTAQDYTELSKQVKTPEEAARCIMAEGHPGEFDLRGFEIARAQWFNTTGKLSVTLSFDRMRFSTASIRRFGEVQLIELLVHPIQKLLVVRPAQENNHRAVRWARTDVCIPCSIGGSAFLPVLFQMVHWNLKYQYRVQGICRQKGDERLLLFDLRAAEILIPIEKLETNGIHPVQRISKRTAIALPSKWGGIFGSNLYLYNWKWKQSSAGMLEQWKVMEEAKPLDPVRERDFAHSRSIKSSIRMLAQELQGKEGSDGE